MEEVRTSGMPIFPAAATYVATAPLRKSSKASTIGGTTSSSMDAAPPAAAPGALPVSMPSSLVVTASRRVSSAENLSSISLDRGPRECARLGHGEKCDESRGEACATLMKPKDGRCGGGHTDQTLSLPRPPRSSKGDRGVARALEIVPMAA